MTVQKSTNTEIARLSVLELSLIYFLPLLSLVLHYLTITSFRTPGFSEGNSVLFGSPLFSIPCAIAVLLFLLLPAHGAIRYVRTAVPQKKYILAAVSSVIPALFFVLWSSVGGFILPNIAGALSTIIYVILPFILLLFIPVWFTIPMEKSPRLPQLLGVLSPLILLLPLLCNMLGFMYHFSASDLLTLLGYLGAIICTLAGILLMTLAANHTVVPENP